MSVNIDMIYSKTKEKYKLNLIAGAAGVNSVINWTYIMEDVTTADFIRGGELIITTGLGIKSEEDFLHMIQVLIEQRAAGLIVNTGNYVTSIPRNVIDLGNKAGFSIFVMPWEIHLVDVTQEYCNWIIRDRQKQQNIAECFYNILYSEDKTEVSQVERFEFDIEGLYSTMLLRIPKELMGMEEDEIYKYFEMELFSKIKTVVKYGSVIHENQFIVIMQYGEDNELIERIEQVYRNNEVLQKGSIGIGSVQKGIHHLKKAYKHALSAYKIASFGSESTIFYENLGVSKILMEIEDKEVLENIFCEYLGKIEEQDRVHSSKNYMDTLQLYLKYNGSIQLVAKESFTHRNTINYRMKKIKEILGYDLEDTKDKFMLQLCFYIKDILNITENKK
jgi:hypothetical protein